MLKFFKDAFTNYEYAEILQTTSLILFVVFFLALMYLIWRRPKDYYKNEAELPLDEKDHNF